MQRELSCQECGRRRVHDLEGLNMVRRPVWRCSVCGETRVGPFAGAGEIAMVDGGDRA